MKSSSGRFLVIFSLILMLALAACNLPQAPASSTQDPGVQPGQTGQATTAPGGNGTVPNEPPAKFEIKSLTSGLDVLDSYRITFTTTTSGVDDEGKQRRNSLTLTEEIIRSQNAYRAVWEFVDEENPQGEPFETVVIGDTAYSLFGWGGDSTCMVYTGEDAVAQREGIMDVDTFVSDVSNMELVGRNENINGIATHHYRGNYSSFMMGGKGTAVADVWVTLDGKYAIRYQYVADGVAQWFGNEETQGRMEMSYELTAINQVPAITIPQTCTDMQNTLANLPIPANATDVNQFGNMISFNLPAAPADANAAVRAEAAAKGWQVVNDSSMEGFFMFDLSKGDETYSVIISAGSEDNTSSVILNKN